MVLVSALDLDVGFGTYPKRAGHAVLISDVGRLEEGGGPRPLGYDDGRGQSGLDVAACTSRGRRLRVRRNSPRDRLRSRRRGTAGVR